MPREQVEIRRVWHDVTRFGRPYFVIIVRRSDGLTLAINTFSEWMASLCEGAKRKQPVIADWHRSSDDRGNTLIDVELAP